ncbi:MAG TPA: lytic transglycosylase F [Candidatus Sulfotelmatobacter sp.]|nr:lytic transglycosylase F [Candidatus Sulfotelmatobacter sp.]
MGRLFVSRNLAVLVAAGAFWLASPSAAQPARQPATPSPSPGVVSKPWTGDFDGMFERRSIRILVPYSRTLFYGEKGREHGLAADLAKDFETYLNQKHAKELGGRRLAVAIIPTTRDKLLSELVAGRGDIASGNLTATKSRMETADFVAPTERDPALELLISGPRAPAIATLDDLSGKTVNVRQASSYFESLNALNDKLRAAGKPAVQIVTMPDALEDEDVLELLNAGLFDFTVVDSWKAKLWAQTAPNIKVHDDIVLRSGGTIGWAIRKQSPKLRAEIEGFYKTAAQQGLIESRLANYQARLKEIATTYIGPASRRFEQTLALFRTYGKQYSFDPLMMAIDGYQESQVKQGAGQPAAAPPVSPSAEQLAQDVQERTKSINELMSKNFPDAKFSDIDRTLFTFASYKSGADNITRMRKEAERRGLDPNLWFNNVELVTAETYGMLSTAYVRDILKYDVAYKIINGSEAAQAK